jgi:2-hydroxy-4-carboxymuconate semialdehyde hemiacetal dehydrogenase
MPENALRVAIVGPGAIADLHAEALAAAGCDLVAAAGPNAADTEDFAHRHGIPTAEAALERVLERADVDALAVCSPSPFHAEQTIQALRAGKHVLCEIPVAVTLADAERVAEVARETGRRVLIGHTMRFWEPVVALRHLVESGSFRATHVIARSTMLRQTNVGWTGKTRDWVDDVLWHHGAHVADTAIWLLGEPPASVTGIRGPEWPGSGNHMDVGLVLGTASGQVATLALSFHSRTPLNDYVVVGEDETYELRDGSLHSSNGVVVDGGSTADVQAAAIRRQDLHFVRSLQAGVSPHPSVVDVLPAMRALSQAHATGRAWSKAA